MKTTIEERFKEKLKEIIAEQKAKNIPHIYQAHDEKENEFFEEYQNDDKYLIIYDKDLNLTKVKL